MVEIANKFILDSENMSDVDKLFCIHIYNDQRNRIEFNNLINLIKTLQLINTCNLPENTKNQLKTELYETQRFDVVQNRVNSLINEKKEINDRICLYQSIMLIILGIIYLLLKSFSRKA